MTAKKWSSSPSVREWEHCESKSAFWFVPGFATAALLAGCAGELDKDPSTFTNAVGTAASSSGGTAASSGGTAASLGGTAASLGGAAAGSTAGSSGAAPAVIPEDDACVAGVLKNQGCTACHGAATASLIGAGLVLEGSNLGERLSTTKASYMGVQKNPGQCVQDALIIDPVTPANSILLKKISRTQDCGDPMPQTGGLMGADLQCFSDWINKF